MTRPRTQRLPARSASAWLFMDGFAKLPALAQLFVACTTALLIVIVIAWWWAILPAIVILAMWRMWLRHAERSARQGTIPYGKLSMIEWTACRLIGIGERLLRHHNMRRPPT